MMQMFGATAKLDPVTVSRMSGDFWQKWQETVSDMADTARQSVGAKSVADVFTAQIGFGVRNAERWTQWSPPAVDVDAAMEPEVDAEPEIAPAPAPAAGGAAGDSVEVSSLADETAPEAAPVGMDQQPAEAALAPVFDDLTRIRGIGPAIERKLHARGVTSFQQIADLSDGELSALDDALDFRGRIERDEWVAQARKLTQR